MYVCMYVLGYQKKVVVCLLLSSIMKGTNSISS